MIRRTQITFNAWGERFAPSTVSTSFSEAHDPGAIGKSGRYRGLPMPFGSAEFNAPENESDKITFLHRIVVPLLPALRAAGADKFWLSITYHTDSGSLGFSKREIKMLAEMECDVPINCLIEELSTQSTADASSPRQS